MSARTSTIESVVSAAYSAHADPSFRSLIDEAGANDEGTLADLVQADGLRRIAGDMPVTLDRYLDAIPALASRPEPLDAAIEVALRSESGSSKTPVPVIDRLTRRYPTLAGAIREAAALGNALLSTDSMRARVTPAPVATLPAPFGPTIDDGQPRYLLTESLGSGASGHVYAAVDRHLSDHDNDARVAIKIMHTHPLAGESDARFEEEAKKARRVTHANVVRLFEYGVSPDGTPFLVYELIDGVDLSTHLERVGRLTDQQAVRLVERLARGVQAVHARGLLHADLKPANVLIDERQEPRITDFGVAVRFEHGESRHASEAGPRGNVAFMAPEQFLSLDAADAPPADVAALGGLLFYLLTGQLPYGESIGEVRAHHESDPDRSRRSLASQLTGIDAQLRAVCLRALDPDPLERHASADELARDLGDWLAHRPVRWTRPSATRRVVLWWRRNPRLALLSLLIVLLTGASVFAIGSLWIEARTSRIEASMATERDSERQEWLENQRIAVRNRLLSLVKRINADESRTDHDLLALIDMVEWSAGSGTLVRGDDRYVVREHRVGVVRRIIDEYVERGTGDSVEALFWRLALVHWLIDTGEFVEASAVFAYAQDQAGRVLLPDDPMRRRTEVLGAVLTLTRGEQDDGFDLSDTEREDAVRVLESAGDLFHGAWDRSPLEEKTAELLSGDK